jgi:anaerobic selenocysteine-containing dehydrogenase
MRDPDNDMRETGGYGMNSVKRRDFLKLATLGTGGLLGAENAFGQTPHLQGKFDLSAGGKDFSLVTKKERTTIPSVCWQCVNSCAIVGYLEEGRLVKIEGNPRFRTNNGKLCARGQAGINQLYNPDRLLYPMVRTGKRGEGKWRRVSWDEALDLLVNGGEIAGHRVKGLKTLRDEGVPEKYLFHYGRMVGSDWLINIYYFCKAYGTGSIGDHNSICVNAGGIAGSLMGDTSPTTPIEDCRSILVFGSSVLEAGCGLVARIRDYTEAMARGAKMYVFDTRLSNTAAKGTEWIPIKPGTDQAVILALCHELIRTGLYDEIFVRDHTNISVDNLKSELSQYTPEWAEGISTVRADKIRSIAREFGELKPNLCTSARGAFMHYNGVQTQRALYMLRALSGALSAPGVQDEGPRWDYAFPFPQPDPPPKTLNVFSGEEGQYAIPDYGVSHQIVDMIVIGPERPEIYMVYCHNPVYSNGNCRDNARVYKDEEKIPFLVACDIILSETSELADLVLPDATYLERWTLHGATAPDHTPEYYIRQPMHPPLGEARNFCDVLCDIAVRLEFNLGFRSTEEFVRETINNTHGVKEVGGLEYMKQHGIWHDTSASTSPRERGEVTVTSDRLAEAGFDGIPAWMPIPSHEEMGEDDLILTTFKVPVQTHSRTQNCKWLTELFHENPAWINTETAARRGIRHGDSIRVKSCIGEIVTKANVTEGVHPKAIAIAHHAGHWAHGVYASGRKSHVHTSEPDSENKWWKYNGTHVNLIIPRVGDPISGSMCWMDTVVQVEKA